MRLKAICIKEYKDEDSLQDFEDGLIKKSDIVTYKVGDSGVVIEEYYDKKYWKVV